jgi:Phage P22-like portal protein
MFKSPTVPAVELDEFMRTARERYAYALSLDAADRARAIDDVRFAAATPVEGGGSSQWSAAAIRQRKAKRRPILTENRLPTFISQVVNDGRQKKPGIRITPLDGGSVETAEMLQSRIRHIEYEADADIVYDTARRHQVTSGRGFVRVTTRYKDGHLSNEQEPWLERINNQFSVLFGAAKDYDCGDAEYCFVSDTIDKEEHERLYGQDTLAARNGYFLDDSSVSPAPDWFGVGANGQQVRRTEYWLKRHKMRTRVQLKDGETRWAHEAAPELVDESVEPWEADDLTVVQYILNGVEILDETEFLIPFHSIVPQWGDEQVVDGERQTYSLIRYAKEPQRMLNLYVTSIAEFVGLAPKNPYRAPAGAIAGFEHLWEKINEEARGVIPYNQFDNQGHELRPPERETAEPPIQALVIGYNQAVDAIKAAMGIFDPSLGARSNETSGLAIETRQHEADNTNFHFHDNEARTRKAIGRRLLALIEKLDQGEKTVPVRTEDGKTHAVRINTARPYLDEHSGKLVHHKIGSGKYAVAASTAPSYTSQREEAFATYSKIANADPRFMTLAGDILFRNLDAPGSEQIAERYEQALPPGLKPPDKGQLNIPPQVRQQLIQGQQMAVQQHQMILDLQQQLASKQPEVSARLQIANLQEETKRQQIEAQVRIAELNAGVTAAVTRLEQQISAIQHTGDLNNSMLDRAHEYAMQVHQAGLDRQQAQDDAAAQQPQQPPDAGQPPVQQ